MAPSSIGVSTPIITKYLVLTFCSTLVVGAKYSSKYSEHGLHNAQNKITTHNSNVFLNNSLRSHDINAIKRHSSEDIKKTKIPKNHPKHGISMAVWPVISGCVDNKGVEECLKIFLIRRIERVKTLIREDNNVSIVFDDIQTEILKNFKWEDYKTVSNSELDAILINQIQGFVENKRIKLVLRPGIDLDLIPQRDGSIQLDLRKDQNLQLPRGSKSKLFYEIVPFLLIPPLIMSAILPFILPAMKMMIIGSSIFNQIALGGAIFTLMRNGIFNDKYEKKVIYVNDGYKNEHVPPRIVHHESFKKHPEFNQEHEDHKFIDSHTHHHYNDFHNPNSHQPTHVEFAQDAVPTLEEYHNLDDRPSLQDVKFFNSNDRPSQGFKEHNSFIPHVPSDANFQNLNVHQQANEYNNQFQDTQASPANFYLPEEQFEFENHKLDEFKLNQETKRRRKIKRPLHRKKIPVMKYIETAEDEFN